MLGLKKNAAIILPDADIELTVRGVPGRQPVLQRPALHRAQDDPGHQSIAEQFLRRFSDELAKLKMGMPWEKG